MKRAIAFALAALLCPIAFAQRPAAKSAAKAPRCVVKSDHRRLDKTYLQNLQVSKVNYNKEAWRRDAAEVAARELSTLLGQPAPSLKARLQVEPSRDEHVQKFKLANGADSYEITVKKLSFLLPYSGSYPVMMWTVTDVVSSKC